SPLLWCNKFDNGGCRIRTRRSRSSWLATKSEDIRITPPPTRGKTVEKIEKPDYDQRVSQQSFALVQQV
ncbi:MAG: hypothetical protein PHU83_08445, partial [Eubacteriales bacterium]|nr:hypothetical protein [Eubacteriales bacterium]